MFLLLHGDNLAPSRNRLVEVITKAKQAGQEVLQLQGKKASLVDIRQALETQSFFGDNKLVVIEHLANRPQSTEKKQILDYLYQHPAESATALVLWENKLLTPVQLKKFNLFKTETFKISSNLFYWLDKLSPQSKQQSIKQLEELIKQESAELVFAMLCRHLRMLILANSGSTEAIPSWQRGKLEAQAKRFDQANLLKLYGKCLEIDVNIKTGKAMIGLAGQLDLLVYQI